MSEADEASEWTWIKVLPAQNWPVTVERLLAFTINRLETRRPELANAKTAHKVVIRAVEAVIREGKAPDTGLFRLLCEHIVREIG